MTPKLKKLAIGLIAVMAAGFLVAVPTEAATLVFDQGVTDNAGSITYDGAGGNLIGTDIVFTNFTGILTPLNNGITFDCDSCLLNFQTGGNLTEAAGANGEYTFAAGGTFTITGGSLLGGIAGGTTLVSGIITSIVTADLSGTSFEMSIKGLDEKHPDLLDLFFNNPPGNFVGVASEIQSGGAGITRDTTTGSFDIDLSKGGNADFVNSNVPEPGTTTLLLLGLGGLAAYRRRQN